MSEASLPSWIQEVVVLVVGSISIIIGVWSYIKTETGKLPKKEHKPADIVAASFIESKLLKELIEALREHQEEGARTALRLTRSNADLIEYLIRNTDALQRQTDFMSRREDKDE